jgi:hypothetical protein
MGFSKKKGYLCIVIDTPFQYFVTNPGDFHNNKFDKFNGMEHIEVFGTQSEGLQHFHDKVNEIIDNFKYDSLDDITQALSKENDWYVSTKQKRIPYILRF